MIIKLCDICGNPIATGQTGALAIEASLPTLAGVAHVCESCAAAAQKVDWHTVIRTAWKEAADQCRKP